jgi:8-oxo-dGTP diphosphatase
VTVNEMLAWAWHRAKPLQGWLAWFLHANFAVGVTGIVRADNGQLLLLRHRLWPEGGQWGFPSGFAKRGEQFQDTIVREVREETGLTVTAGRLLDLRSGYRYKAEAYFEATLVGGTDGMTLDSREILEARLFRLEDLPRAMPPLHRELARRGAKTS